jgi:hypothetical protein
MPDRCQIERMELWRGYHDAATLATLKAMKQITNARNKQVKRASRKLSKVFADADSSDEAIDAIWSGYFARVKQHDHELLDPRYELREQLTREEWEAVFCES